MSGRISLEIESERAIARLTVVNPEKRNAISASMWREIHQSVLALRERSDVRVVLVSGAGKYFSAGADISDFSATRSGDAIAQSYDDLVESTCRALEEVPQVTIALVAGPCFGAGASLAASCDLRIATEDARFAVPAARLGLGYDVRGIERIVRVFGHGAAQQLLLTGEPIPAPRVHALGAVHVISPLGEAEATARALAERVASNAPLTLRAVKAALRAISLGDATFKDQARELASAADASADYREGRAAFAERRAPKFLGR